MRYPRAKRLTRARGQLRDMLNDQRAPGRGRRPGCARALGGRPDRRQAATVQVATLVERTSRYVMLLHCPSGPTRTRVCAALTAAIAPAAGAAAPLAHLGPGHGNGRPHRSSPSTPTSRSTSATRTALAARHQREHCEYVAGARSGLTGQAGAGSERRLSRILAACRRALRWTCPSSCRGRPGPLVSGLIRSLSALAGVTPHSAAATE